MFVFGDYRNGSNGRGPTVDWIVYFARAIQIDARRDGR